MTTETLNAYASEQKSSVLAGIVNEVDTLKALSVIIGENPEKTYIDAYLKALNSSSASNVFQYTSASEPEILVSKYPENAQPVAALKKRGRLSFPTCIIPLRGRFGLSLSPCPCLTAQTPLRAGSGG